MPDQPKTDPENPIPAQGEELKGNSPQDIADTNSALDELLKQVEKPEEEAAPEAEKEAADKAAKEKEAAEKEAADKAAKEAAENQTPEEKAAAEKKAADKAAAEKAAAEDFEKVELPPYTKPKSVEAFAKVKALAGQKIAAIEAEKAKLAEELAAAKESASKAIKPEVEKELEELRAFRLKFDVEADPQFNKFDQTVKENEELIYARMKAAGIDENSIKRIKELGGPEQVDWDAIKEKIPAPLMRYIEAKIFENGDLSEKKRQAIEAAKKNASEFVKTRQEEIVNQTTGRAQATKAAFDAMLPKFDWLKEKPIPVTAKPEEKAAIESANSLTKKVLADVQEALNDDSPEMRSILIAGFAQLMKVRADFDSAKAAHTAEIAKLTATIKEKEAFIEKIKNASTPRLTGRATTPGEVTTPQKSSINEDPGEAVDRLLKEALAKAE